MATVAPSSIKEFDPATIEKIAYNSVATIPTREPNDQYRLGYNVWIYLSEKKGTLEQAVKNSGTGILIPEQEAISIIKRELDQSGVQ